MIIHLFCMHSASLNALIWLKFILSEFPLIMKDENR